MNRIAKRLATALCFLVCAVMLIAVPLSACSTHKISYTVTFTAGDLPEGVECSGLPEEQIISSDDEDGKATKPTTDPTAEGYTFVYWYDTSAATKSEYDFNTVVTQDITLGAHWEEKISSYTVTFVIGNGNANSTSTVTPGDTVTKPTDPTADGYIFVGWYTDAAGTTAFDFSTPITGDTTIYAVWTTNAVVTIDLTGITGIAFADGASGTYTAAVKANLYDILYSTEITSRLSLTGKYVITGWKIKGDSGDTAVTETTTVTSNITVYPVVQEADETITITSVDGVTLSVSSIDVVTGSDLENAINGAGITYTCDDETGVLTGWQYSTDDGATWKDVTSGITITSGMTIKPVMKYTSTITITFDASIASVTYNGSAVTSGSTIAVDKGTAYSTIISGLTITVADHYNDDATVYLGNSGTHTDITDGENVTESQVSLFIAATPETYTLTYASTADYMSTSMQASTVTYGDSANISFSEVASSYTNKSGYDLEGFYLATDGVVDTTTLYETTATYTGTLTGDTVVYPVLTFPRSNGGTDDEGVTGLAVAYHDGKPDAGSTVTTSNFNTTTFRMESIIDVTLNTSTTDSGLDGLGTFYNLIRVKMYNPGNASDKWITSGTRYNVEWTITNYSSGSVTMTLYFLDHGYAYSGDNQYTWLGTPVTVTLAEGGTYTFVETNEKIKDDTCLFLMITVTSYSLAEGDTTFEFGACCDYSIGSSVTLTLPEGSAINDDWLEAYLYDYDESSNTYTIYRDSADQYNSNVLGTEDIELPTADDLTGAEGMNVIWTSEGETVSSIGSGASATLTLEKKYTVTINTSAVATEAGLTYTGDDTYAIDSTESLYEFLRDTVDSLISIEGNYVLNGWYYYTTEGDDSTKTTITESTTISGDVTVYPDISATDATMYVVSNTESVTITTPASGNTVAISSGKNLQSIIDSYTNDGKIVYSGIDEDREYIISWQYKESSSGTWAAVEDSTTTTDGMYIGLVVTYMTTVTITYDTQIVTNIEYDDIVGSNGTMTITVAEGTSYKDILADVTVELDSVFTKDAYAFYEGTDATGNAIDLTNSDKTFSGTSVAIYVTTTDTTRTVTLTTEVTDITLSGTISFDILKDSTVSLPSSATGVPEGKTLVGWYVEDSEGNAYGADNGIYEFDEDNTTLTVSVGVTTGNLIIWPIYTYTDVYNLVVNNNKNSSYSVSDKAGVIIGAENGATSIINSTYMYNKADNVTEYTVTSSQALDEGYWFRFNTIATAAVTLTADTAYDFYYALTNYGTDEITVGLYHCTDGMVSNSTKYVLETVTIVPGQTVYISFLDFVQPSATNENNFITVIQIVSGTTGTLALGARVGVDTFTANTITATVTFDTTDENVTLAENSTWGSSTFYVGGTYSLPAAETDYTLEDGCTLAGWYLYDANGNLIETLDSTATQFTVTSDSVTLKPYIVSTADMTKTLSLASTVKDITVTDITFNISSDTYVTLPSAESINLEGTTKTLTGWYIEDEDGNIYGSAENGIYNPSSQLAVDINTGNLTMWPVYTDSFYNLTANSEHEYSANSPVVDYTGSANNFGTKVSEYNTHIGSATMFNKNDCTTEFAVTAPDYTLASGSWFRLNTNITTALGGNTSTNTKYNIYYAITNYTNEDLTVYVAHCTDGYWSSTTGNKDMKSVTIAAGATEYITFYAFDTLSKSGNNFLTLIQFFTDDDTSVSDFVLGVRARIETYTDSSAATTDATVSFNLEGITGFTVAESYTTSGHVIGSKLTVPTSSEYTNETGKTLTGWYCYDENGCLVCVDVGEEYNPIYLISADSSFTITSSTVTLVPVFEDATD